MFVSFQETEEDLNESEEYKLARDMLDSVKLEGWFQICVLADIHLLANIHSLCQALFINCRQTESIQSFCTWCNYFYCLRSMCHHEGSNLSCV